MANENHHDAAASSTVPLQLLDKKQLAKRIGVSVRTIENLVKAGEFPLACASVVSSIGPTKSSRFGSGSCLQRKTTGSRKLEPFQAPTSTPAQKC